MVYTKFKNAFQNNSGVILQRFGMQGHEYEITAFVYTKLQLSLYSRHVRVPMLETRARVFVLEPLPSWKHGAGFDPARMFVLQRHAQVIVRERIWHIFESKFFELRIQRQICSCGSCRHHDIVNNSLHEQKKCSMSV